MIYFQNGGLLAVQWFNLLQKFALDRFRNNMVLKAG